MTYSIQTKAEKDEVVQARRLAQRDLGARIDRHLAEVGEQPAGCGLCGLGALLSRARSRARPAAASAGTALGTAAGNAARVVDATAAAATRQATGAHALFGLRKGKADPHAKLQEAAAAMQGRIEQLEARVGEGQSEAKRLMGLGQKAAALRAMRKVKAVEKQVASNQAALDAVEQQVDLMQQAVMQKTVATALQTSSKGLKGQKKLLQQAEGAVEDAAEARDMAEDLSTVMGEFAQNGHHDDDDELLAELDALILGDGPTPPNETEEVGVEAAEAAAMARDAAVIEARDAAWRDAERARRALPAAPSSRRRAEQTALLTPANAV